MRRNSWPEHVLCLCIATGPRLHVKQGSAGPRIPWSPSQDCSPPSLSPLGGISPWAFLLRVFGGGRPWLSMAGQPASLPLTRGSSQALAIHRRWLDQAEGLLARVSESGSTSPIFQEAEPEGDGLPPLLFFQPLLAFKECCRGFLRLSVVIKTTAWTWCKGLLKPFARLPSQHLGTANVWGVKKT